MLNIINAPLPPLWGVRQTGGAGGPAGKKVVLFVDDINMPVVEEYGAQPPNELLRQFQDYKGFWDREKLFWKDICDTMMAGAAAAVR